MKSVRIWSYSGQHFPAFGLNTEQNNSKYWRFFCSGQLYLKNNLLKFCSSNVRWLNDSSMELLLNSRYNNKLICRSPNHPFPFHKTYFYSLVALIEKTFPSTQLIIRKVQLWWIFPRKNFFWRKIIYSNSVKFR